jgi:hypothetical protein
MQTAQRDDRIVVQAAKVQSLKPRFFLAALAWWKATVVGCILQAFSLARRYPGILLPAGSPAGAATPRRRATAKAQGGGGEAA